MVEFFVGLTALTLFGSVIWFWAIVALFIFICFMSDINENGFYAFGTLLIVSFVSYFWGSDAFIYFKSLFTVTNILIYFGVGLGFSIIRTFFASRKLGKELKSPELGYGQSKDSRKSDFIRELSGNIFRWWLMWPISLLTWLVKDAIKDVWNFIWSKIKRVFLYIVELGIKSV